EVEIDESIQFDPVGRACIRGAPSGLRQHGARKGGPRRQGRFGPGRPGQHEGAASCPVRYRLFRAGDHDGLGDTGPRIRVARRGGVRGELERPGNAQPAADARHVFRPVHGLGTKPAHRTGHAPWAQSRGGAFTLADRARRRTHAAVLRPRVCALTHSAESLHLGPSLNRSQRGIKVRKLILLGLTQALLLLSGCGGSGTVVGSAASTGKGSGTGSGGGQTSNVVVMTVDAGPDVTATSGYDVDTPFITVTVCAPASTTNCQTIDHVEVDTGSYGLRIISSVLTPSLALALHQELAT